MKVLHVLQHSLPSLYGYTIRADAILRAQRALGLEVVALTGAVEQAGPGPEEVINGIRYLRTAGTVNGNRAGFREWKLYHLLLERLREVSEREKPDLVHAHSPAYNGLATLAVARELGLPCVYEMRAVWEDAAVDRRKFGAASLFYHGARVLETHVLRRADAVVTICQGLRGEMLDRGLAPEKVFVVPNAVEPDQFQPCPRDTELAASLGWTGGPVFGFIGSLFNYEGVEDLLDGIPPVLERFPAARLLIVGGGEREAQVKERVARWAQSGQVVWRPRVPHNQVRTFYSLVDCFVYPRRSVRLTELVTPLKPLEAMAMEKAVLASDVGGHREMIEHGRTGLLFPAGDISALADLLCRVAAQPELLRDLAWAGRQYVLEQRNWNTVTADYILAYEAACQAARLARPSRLSAKHLQ